MENNLITFEKPNSVTSELFKSLRTNVEFALKPGKKSIILTSACAGDGKSFVCSNLATAFTQLGKKVLIVDLDLRKRTQHKIFNISNTTGISILLNNDNFEENIDLNDVLLKFIKKTLVDNLYLITAGPIPHNPSEILMNGNLEKLIKHLETMFDYIFIDVPPINVVTDTAIISRYVKNVILVTSIGKTKVKLLKSAVKTLKRNKSNILGVVANRVQINKRSNRNSGYGYDYEYTSMVSANNSKIKQNKYQTTRRKTNNF